MAAPLPRLARSAPPAPVGIVHLGLGAFFRAHGALYVEEAMARSGGEWGILGVSLRAPDVRDRLAPQGGTYHAVELGPAGPAARHVQIVQGVRVAPEDPAAVLSAMADPAVRIVSLTVTEKGYCLDPAAGRLDPAHPDIRRDLAGPLPVSAPGFLVRALALRREAGIPPFTALSCDNLPGNGRLLRGIVLDLAARLDPALAGWIAEAARFPATMVDRIVPATTEADVARTAALTGVHDAAPVVHEPFRQWVVEDDFVAGARPDLAAAGVELVADVAPHETVKLRMLNAAHSALAYLGLLAGHETVAEAMADPTLATYLRRLWAEEIIPAVAPPPGLSLTAHAAALAARFANPAIRHRLAQIATDGSHKLPQRIVPTLVANLAAGRPVGRLCLALAAFVVHVSGRDLAGRPVEVRDPLAGRLAAAASGADPVAGVLAVAEIFPPDLARRLAEPVAAAHAALRQRGVRAALSAP